MQRRRTNVQPNFKSESYYDPPKQKRGVIRKNPQKISSDQQIFIDQQKIDEDDARLLSAFNRLQVVEPEYTREDIEDAYDAEYEDFTNEPRYRRQERLQELTDELFADVETVDDMDIDFTLHHGGSRDQRTLARLKSALGADTEDMLCLHGGGHMSKRDQRTLARLKSALGADTEDMLCLHGGSKCRVNKARIEYMRKKADDNPGIFV